MGWFSSDKVVETDNKGLLNGNFINNGNFVKEISENIADIEYILYAVLFVVILVLVIISLKCLIKVVKKQSGNERCIETIMLQNAQR